MPRSAWDLTALINAADPAAQRAERHLWLVRLVEWLRHGQDAADSAGDSTPRPVLRLKHLLNMLERNPAPRAQVVALLARLWRECDVAALFADFGFTARNDLGGEVLDRLRLRLLPGTPDTDDLAELFGLAFTHPGDADWLAAIDPATLARLATLLADARQAETTGALSKAPVTMPAPDPADPAHTAAAWPAPADDWRQPLLQAGTWLVSSMRAAAFSPGLRRRMDPALLGGQPFEQLVRRMEAFSDALTGQAPPLRLAQEANLLRALLQRCREAAASVTAHLDAHGISVDIVFELEQLQARSLRLEALIDTLLAPQPAPTLQLLLVDMVRLSRQRRSLRALLARQYSLLARKVAERHAETGEHYITRTPAEYHTMLRQAAGGGLVIGGTTFAKFGIAALGLAPFWAGMGAGLNYALSFVIVHLLHWTVATKQPAMTAPAMADKLAGVRSSARAPGPRPTSTDTLAGQAPGPAPTAAALAEDQAAVEGFVDEVTHLVRSQFAGIVGNLAAVIPTVLAVQWLAWALLGRPLLGEDTARYVLHSTTLLGPTALFAAFTGVLLFASSLVAGWAENWFVYHRLDSALAWHPRMVARLGAPRAARWAAWWRRNISGMVANVSLGLMLGLVPVLLAFVALPIEVRHVTLSTGQLAAAASTLGWATLAQPVFWWCVAGLLATGVLNLGVSFSLALAVALRSRGIGGLDRRRLLGAVARRMRQAPRSFVLPARGTD